MIINAPPIRRNTQRGRGSTLNLDSGQWTWTGVVLGRACSSHVKVVLRHVLGRVDVYASVAGPKLVT